MEPLCSAVCPFRVLLHPEMEMHWGTQALAMMLYAPNSGYCLSRPKPGELHLNLCYRACSFFD